MTPAAGDVTLARGYTPYGEILNSAGDAETNYGFTGEWTDSYSGLVYLRARYYSPWDGRFIHPDTVLPNPYFPVDWNLYLYVRDNPINFIDPTGNVVWSLIGGTNRFHELIELVYHAEYGNYKTHLEYGRHAGVGNSPIGGSRAIDLIYFPIYNIVSGGTGFEFGGLTIGEVYEIEPITVAFEPGSGVDQARGYVDRLFTNADRLNGIVVDRAGVHDGEPYNWQYVKWRLGNSISSEPRSLSLRGGENRSLIFWKHAPGLIVYMDTNNRTHVEELIENPAFQSIRYSVVAINQEIFNDYDQQLRSSALACYSGIDSKYWDPKYKDFWKSFRWLLDKYWEGRINCEKNSICRYWE